MKEQEELIDEVEEDATSNEEKETPEFSEDLVHGI